jgi:hypothetical protein
MATVNLKLCGIGMGWFSLANGDAAQRTVIKNGLSLPLFFSGFSRYPSYMPRVPMYRLSSTNYSPTHWITVYCISIRH